MGHTSSRPARQHDAPTSTEPVASTRTGTTPRQSPRSSSLRKAISRLARGRRSRRADDITKTPSPQNNALSGVAGTSSTIREESSSRVLLAAEARKEQEQASSSSQTPSGSQDRTLDIERDLDNERPGTPFPQALSSSEPGTSSNIGNWLSGQQSTQQRLEQAPDQFSNGTDTANTQNIPIAQAAPAGGRLVVVQGVVQTSDAPHRRSPSPLEIPDRMDDPMSSSRGNGIHTNPSQESSRSQLPNLLSPSSVDVLGTLLSVAAAATAASLLTDSTPSADTSPSPPAPADGSGLRQAWSSLRERLGLQGIAPGSASNNSSGSNAREAMFAEMARAFDVGNVLSSSDDSQERSANTRSASFERFLADLQSDLRRLLHWGGPSSHVSAAEAVDSTDTTLSPRTSLESTTGLSHHTPETSASSSDTRDHSHVRGDDIQSHPEPESESGEDDMTSANDRDDSAANSADSTLLQDANGEVNWWRVYSFPQVPISNGLSEFTESQRPEASSSEIIHDSTPSVASNTSAMDTHEPPTAPPSAEPQLQPFSIPPFLIPVIIVGFRAINPDSQEGGQRAAAATVPRTTTPETFNESAMSDVDSGTHSDSNLDLPIANESDGSPAWPSHVTRSYHSSTQMSPQPAAESNNDNMTSVSRTFLIYVIGGHYPPNHPILTAGPDVLRSFEAIGHLAEMFRPSKPPTASKDEIARSGLELIHISQLQEYERQGKVASNCVDKCLICLEDYEHNSPDLIRVLGCRHAFHQTCVDTWLETGRNNCPACRTTGVATDV